VSKTTQSTWERLSVWTPRDSQDTKMSAEVATFLPLGPHCHQQMAQSHTMLKCDPEATITRRHARAVMNEKLGRELNIYIYIYIYKQKTIQVEEATCEVEAAKVQLAFHWQRVEYLECWRERGINGAPTHYTGLADCGGTAPA
jgi:hypothetical protein